MLRRLIPDKFVLALIATVSLATLLPARGGAAVAVHWLSNFTILLLFFFHGAKLSSEAAMSGVRHWRLHLIILATTFVFFPALCVTLSNALPQFMPAPLWTGIIYIGALPATVQSAIAFTSIARGNVPAAIASASASQVLGVFVTPLLVGLLTGSRGGHIPLSSVVTIIVQILVPFLAGQLSRPWIGRWVQERKAVIALTDRATILIAIYSAFSGAVIEGLWSRLSLPAFGVLIVLCLVILIAALLFTRTVARLFGFPEEDEIAIVFCGTKKSLVQGVPMAGVLFAGPDLGIILLPIMIFHQLQLMVCAGIARRYASRPSKGVSDE